LKGQFLGLKAVVLLRPFFEHLGGVERGVKSILHLTDLARNGGITTMAEMMQGSFNMLLEEKLFSLVFEDPKVPVRCVVVKEALKEASRFGYRSVEGALGRVFSMEDHCSEKLIYNRGVKFFMDDAFLGLTMQMNAPGYIDGHKGIWNSQPGQATAQVMLPFWKAGCRIHVHTNGHASQSALCDVLACLQRICPRVDHRFCFEHFGMSSDATIRRLKELGANCSVNPFYHYLRADLNEKHIGVDRAHTSVKMKSLLNNGVVVAMHTDTPVAPPRPLQEMWIATNRLSTAGQCLSPEEIVTPYEALKMKTVDAAYVLGLDEMMGSIEAGKVADFTVLHHSPLKVEAKNIKDIKIWGTVIGGNKFPREKKCELSIEVPAASQGFLHGIIWLFALKATNRLESLVWKSILKLVWGRTLSANDYTSAPKGKLPLLPAGLPHFAFQIVLFCAAIKAMRLLR
jgi:predicted amidohydrolase YtcJ